MRCPDKIRLAASCLLLITVNVCRAQTLKTISDLESRHQRCLDEGINMRGCASDYYSNMDSLLNLAYNSLRKQLGEKEKANLKSEELEWIKNRDTHFKKLIKDEEAEAEVKKKDWREMEYMMLYDAEASYVKERTVVLIKRMNALKGSK